MQTYTASKLNQYWSPLEPVLVTLASSIGRASDQYWLLYRPVLVHFYGSMGDGMP